MAGLMALGGAAAIGCAQPLAHLLLRPLVRALPHLMARQHPTRSQVQSQLLVFRGRRYVQCLGAIKIYVTVMVSKEILVTQFTNLLFFDSLNPFF